MTGMDDEEDESELPDVDDELDADDPELPGIGEVVGMTGSDVVDFGGVFVGTEGEKVEGYTGARVVGAGVGDVVGV